MIDSIYKCDKTNNLTIYNSGCGCCSDYYDLNSEEYTLKDFVDYKEHLKKQIDLVNEAIIRREN